MTEQSLTIMTSPLKIASKFDRYGSVRGMFGARWKCKDIDPLETVYNRGSKRLVVNEIGDLFLTYFLGFGDLTAEVVHDIYHESRGLIRANRMHRYNDYPENHLNFMITNLYPNGYDLMIGTRLTEIFDRFSSDLFLDFYNRYHIYHPHQTINVTAIGDKRKHYAPYFLRKTFRLL